MKGKVFIAWSGENTLAKSVKEILVNEGFECIVGGENGCSGNRTVCDTIMREINNCNQAIFIVQKKDDGNISNNIMFEYGYASARFKDHKTHVFFVDIDENDESIPSDIRGIWADYRLSSSDGDTAWSISQRFMEHQRYLIPEYKCDLANEYYKVKDIIRNHVSYPIYSEYELAQYVIFFTQTAYQYRNDFDALACLKELACELTDTGEELTQTLSLSINYIETLMCIKGGEKELYIEKSDFREKKQSFKDMERISDSWEEDDFSLWFRAVLFDIINYAYLLFADNPNISDDRKRASLEESIRYGNKCIEVCDKLLCNATNKYFCEMFKAYQYRNIAVAHKKLGDNEAGVRKFFELSYEERRILWERYKIIKEKMNPRLYENYEMEYFLALSEHIEYINDEMDREDACEECMKYIERARSAAEEKSFFINKIMMNITADAK